MLATFNMFAELYQVTAASLNVRNKPSAQSEIIGKVQKGMSIDVIDVKDGFAHFDFMGVDGYASINYLKKVADEPVAQTTPEPQRQAPAQEPAPVATSSGNATVYLFYDLTHYFESFPVSVNGTVNFCMEGEKTESKMYGTRYKPSMRKLNINGEGRMYISTDYYWADKPFHSDITLDVVDGGVYYVKIHIENLVNAVVKKRGGIYFKQLKPKDGLKELEKENDKYKRNPDVDIYL